MTILHRGKKRKLRHVANAHAARAIDRGDRPWANPFVVPARPRWLGIALSGCVLISLWMPPPLVAPGWCAPMVEEVTKEQHDHLERRAWELNEKAGQLYQQGRYDAATKR